MSDELKQARPYSTSWESGYCVLRYANAPEGMRILMMTPDNIEWVASRMNEAYEAASAKDAELIQTLLDAGNTMRQWLGLTLQMDGESCPDCKYDWGKGHNAGCYQQRHLEAIEAWDAAAQGFKPSDE